LVLVELAECPYGYQSIWKIALGNGCYFSSFCRIAKIEIYMIEDLDNPKLAEIIKTTLEGFKKK